MLSRVTELSTFLFWQCISRFFLVPFTSTKYYTVFPVRLVISAIQMERCLSGDTLSIPERLVLNHEKIVNQLEKRELDNRLYERIERDR